MIIEKELDIARNIQESFLKLSPPEKEGLDIAVRMDTAKAVGGDLYDFIDMPDGKTGIMIGDVSGKGVPAALFMAKTVSEFRLHSKTQNQPDKVLKELNDLISVESTSGLFVTICYLVIDLKEKLMHVVDAGHLPIVITHNDKPTEAIKVEGAMAVGIMDGVEYSQETINFNSGDTFLLYTDGVTEARSIKKEEFEEERLKKAVTEVKSKTAKEIVEHVFKVLRKFQGKAPQHDDITVIAIKIK
jgi:phosphoserine phosphatase RsbU/P